MQEFKIHVPSQNRVMLAIWNSGKMECNPSFLLTCIYTATGGSLAKFAGIEVLKKWNSLRYNL